MLDSLLNCSTLLDFSESGEGREKKKRKKNKQEKPGTCSGTQPQSDIWEQSASDTEHTDMALQGSTSQVPHSQTPLEAELCPCVQGHHHKGQKTQIIVAKDMCKQHWWAAPRSPLSNDTETKIKALQGDKVSLLGSKTWAVIMGREENWKQDKTSRFIGQGAWGKPPLPAVSSELLSMFSHLLLPKSQNSMLNSIFNVECPSSNRTVPLLGNVSPQTSVWKQRSFHS